MSDQIRDEARGDAVWEAFCTSMKREGQSIKLFDLLTFGEACWDASRLAALEEAAKVCEGIDDKYGEDEGGRWPELKSDAQTGARDCESAIRALANPTTERPAALKE